MDTAEAQDPVKPEDEDGRPPIMNSRKLRKTGSTHFGDVDQNDEETEDIGDATWGEVAQACCVHDVKGWGVIFVGVCGALFFLYFFIFSLELLGNAAKVLGGCSAGGLMSDETNPVASLVIGELATALVQSSSTTSSIVVTLVGANAVSVNSGIYLIMGANIGTSVTSTIIAMGQMGNEDQLERAFAGATVHDIFNLLSVAVFFPLELVSGYLYHLTNAMLPETVKEGDKWNGPLKAIVSPLASKVLKANKGVIKDIATGKVESCSEYYPVNCVDGIEDYEHCVKCEDKLQDDSCSVGLITCDKKAGCPFFFQHGATQQNDNTSGAVCLFLSLVLLLLCLMGLVNVLQRGLMGMSTRVIYKATHVPGVFAIIIGAAITVLVQSSSITTSVLTPLVGIGVIQLEQMLPLTLGANIGTTVTGLLAALVSGKLEALQVALAHLFFNLSGIAVWYPIPFMRRVPLNGAKALGKWTHKSRSIPPIYVATVFFAIPLLLLGLSELFIKNSVAYTVLGSFIVILMLYILGRIIWFWNKQDGRQKFIDCLDRRAIMSSAKKNLPEDMQYLKTKVGELIDHTGLPEDEIEEEEEEVKPADEETPAAIATTAEEASDDQSPS